MAKKTTTKAPLPAELAMKLKSCGLSDEHVANLVRKGIDSESLVSTLAGDSGQLMAAAGCEIGHALKVQQLFSRTEQDIRDRIYRLPPEELAQEFVAARAQSGPLFDRVQSLTGGRVPKVGRHVDEQALASLLAYQLQRQGTSSNPPPAYKGSQFGGINLVPVAQAFESNEPLRLFDMYTGEELSSEGFNPIHNRTFPVEDKQTMELNCWMAANLTRHDPSFDPIDPDHVDSAMAAACAMAEIIAKHAGIDDEQDRQQKIRAALQSLKPNLVNRKAKLCLTAYLDEAANEGSTAIQAANERMRTSVEVAAPPSNKRAAASGTTFRQLPPPADLVILASAKDNDAVRQVTNHLAPMIRNGKITVWDVTKTAAGDTTTDLKVGMMRTAKKMVCLLLSADFLSEHWDIVGAASELRQCGQRIVPIIIKDCDWRETPLGILQPLPRDRSSIARYSDKDEAWVGVVRNIKDVLSLPDSIVNSASDVKASIVVNGSGNTVVVQQRQQDSVTRS